MDAFGVKDQIIDIPHSYSFLYALEIHDEGRQCVGKEERSKEKEKERERERESSRGRNAAPLRTSRRSVYRRRPNMYDPSRRYYSPPLEIAAAAADDDDDDNGDDDGLVATLPAKDRSGSMSRIRAEHRYPRTGPANVPLTKSAV